MYFGIAGNIAFNGNYTATFTFEGYGQETGTFLPQYDPVNLQGGT